jgi:ABC-type amino acid transport substrate-binding protein
MTATPFRVGTRFLGMVASALLLVVLAACGGSSSPSSSSSGDKFTLVKPGYLTVATYGTERPLDVVGPGDVMGGIDGALLSAFAKEHNLKVTLYQTTFPSGILAVQQGKADVGVYYYWNPTRAAVAYYTYPLFSEEAVIFTLNSLNYTGPDSLKGKKVGTLTGSVYTPYLQKVFGSNTLEFPDQTAAGQALLNGQIDAWQDANLSRLTPPLDSANNITMTVLKAGDFGIPGNILANNDYNIVNCNNKALADALNKTLTDLHNNGEWAKTLAANSAVEGSDVPQQSPQQGC